MGEEKFNINMEVSFILKQTFLKGKARTENKKYSQVTHRANIAKIFRAGNPAVTTHKF